MTTKAKFGICMFCNKPGAKDYAQHGRGKGARINYFHKECYERYVKEITKKGEVVMMGGDL